MEINVKVPQCTVFVHANGKLISIGTKSISEARISIRRIARIIQKIGYTNVKIRDLKVQNIAASHDLKIPVPLSSFHHFLSTKRVNSKLDLRVFPNLRVSSSEWFNSAKLIISRRGRVIITGVNTEEDLNFVFVSFLQLFTLFKQNG
jgi:transcription initiation factor TFIID TATA-box-binding protein